MRIRPSVLREAFGMIRKLFPKIFCILAVMLLAFSAAAAESTRSTWEKRLEEARLKYNKDTVNILLGSRNPQKDQCTFL